MLGIGGSNQNPLPRGTRYCIQQPHLRGGVELIANIDQQHGIRIRETRTLREIAWFRVEWQICRRLLRLAQMQAVPIEAVHGSRGAGVEQSDTCLTASAADIEDGAEWLLRRER